MTTQCALDRIATGVITGDGETYTIEVAKEKGTHVHPVIQVRHERHYTQHKCSKHCKCKRMVKKKQYRIKIMARFTIKFLRSLEIENPGNKRNHSIITMSNVQLDSIIDIQTVNCYINVMEEQILKDIAQSSSTSKLVKGCAKDIRSLKMEKYGNDDRNVSPSATKINPRFALQRLSNTK